MLGGVYVTNAADPIRVYQRISHDAFVGCFHVGHSLNAAVATDAILDIVDRYQELATDEYLLPCLQRRQLTRSALAGGFLRLYLLFLYSQGFQADPVGVAGRTGTGTDLRWR